MTTTRIRISLTLVLVVSVVSSLGCIASQGPNLGLLSFPIPVSPMIQKRQEDKFWVHQRYTRVPILPPFTANSPRTALDPPSDDEVMRAFYKSHTVEGGLPLLHELQVNDVKIVTQLIPGSDIVDPPRHYPLIGPAQLHHAHYKCSVYFTEIIRVGWPIPHTLEEEEKVEVIYIDHDHLHQVGNINPGVGSNY